jgi:chromosome segregation ATPase
VENELQRAESTRSELTAELQRARSGASDESGSMRTVLEGLWSIIGHDDLDEDDEPEPFNIHAFSAKVQRLFNQCSGLREQKEVLQRQIKQQRELNNKSDEVKDREITELTEKLEETQEMLDKTEQQCSDLEHRIADLMEEVENLNMAHEATQGEATKNAEQLVVTTRTLQDRNDEIEKLEDELQDLKLNRGVDNAEVTSRLAEADERVAALGAALTQAESKIAELEDSLKSSILEKSAKEEQIVAHTRQISELESGQTSRVAELELHLEKAKADIDAANLEIARLATEVTIARAELDGAYGSRAQRAAEVAANPMIQNEINTLTSEKERLEKELEQAKGMRGEDRDRMEDLKRELAGMVDEFEAVTRTSVEWERERENLEKEVDKLREVKEELETRLADEKVKALGLRSPGPAGAETPGGTGRVGAGETSTAVLKNEFKKMMRDTRAESARALRVSSSISNCRHAIC